MCVCVCVCVCMLIYVVTTGVLLIAMVIVPLCNEAEGILFHSLLTDI